MNQRKKNKERVNLSEPLDDLATESSMKEQPLEYSFHPGTPKIIQWIIRYSGGLIKNERQAFHILLGLIALAVIISLFLILGRGGMPESIEGTEYHSHEGYGGKELPDDFR